MPRVLIVAENLQQYERLKLALNREEDVYITVANLRQLNSKNLRILRQADLILVEETQDFDNQLPGEAPVAFLKKAGLPVVVVPVVTSGSPFTQRPQILNLTEQHVAQGKLSALLKKIHTHYSAELGKLESTVPMGKGAMASEPNVGMDSKKHSLETATAAAVPAASRGIASSQNVNTASKMTHTLSTIRRISDQLREPLSNMNLAIHMLGRVQSIEERDRYLRLLREEYNRELQLLNQLDNHLETNLPRTP
ncbi:MAG: hypothetical protein AAFQ89_21965 [Cyanobacteria bacterium J06626_18]